MGENYGNEDGRKLSRRDFLKLSGMGIGGIGVAYFGGSALGKFINRGLESAEYSRIEPLVLTPETVSGVEVFGLKEKITSASDVKGFYKQLDTQFAENNGDFDITRKLEQQKKLLDPNERYLEVVVRRSAYDSFLQKQDETGVNFPEWINNHVDILNRCIKKASPTVEMKAVLRRVLVVDDQSVKEFWDESAYRRGSPMGSALDSAWINHFVPSYPIDTDCVWAIADDYRDSGGGNFWEFYHENNSTVIRSTLEDNQLDNIFEFPEDNDSLFYKDHIKFDMGIIHEWSHYLLNLPDEYEQDVHDASQRFKKFTFGTGSFHKPEFGSFLAYLMRENIKLKARNLYSKVDGRTKIDSLFDESGMFEINTHSPFALDNEIEIRRVKLLEDNAYGQKEISLKADQISNTNILRFNNKIFRDGSNCCLLKIVSGEQTREVFLPVAAFIMSELAGKKSAKYDVIFSGYDNVERSTQEVMLVDDSKVVEYIQNNKDPYYARMKVDGTNTWFVWFLREY